MNASVQNQLSAIARNAKRESSATVNGSSLLSWLLQQRSSSGRAVEPHIIHMRRCEKCGVWSSEAICACLKMLPASSILEPPAPPDEEAFAVWQDDGGGEG